MACSTPRPFSRALPIAGSCMPLYCNIVAALNCLEPTRRTASAQSRCLARISVFPPAIRALTCRLTTLAPNQEEQQPPLEGAPPARRRQQQRCCCTACAQAWGLRRRRPAVSCSTGASHGQNSTWGPKKRAAMGMLTQLETCPHLCVRHAASSGGQRRRGLVTVLVCRARGDSAAAGTAAPLLNRRAGQGLAAHSMDAQETEPSPGQGGCLSEG